jgi:ankyrin repeat protein
MAALAQFAAFPQAPPTAPRLRRPDDRRLCVAVSAGDLDRAVKPVQRHAGVNCALPNGATPLHTAALNADVTLCRFLLETAAASVASEQRDGLTTLHRTAHTWATRRCALCLLRRQRHHDARRHAAVPGGVPRRHGAGARAHPPRRARGLRAPL